MSLRGEREEFICDKCAMLDWLGLCLGYGHVCMLPRVYRPSCFHRACIDGEMLAIILNITKIGGSQ